MAGTEYWSPFNSASGNHDGMWIYKRNPEKIKIKGRAATHFFEWVLQAKVPSPVLLFEFKPIQSLLYESLTHCASAQRFGLRGAHLEAPDGLQLWKYKKSYFWHTSQNLLQNLKLPVFARLGSGASATICWSQSRVLRTIFRCRHFYAWDLTSSAPNTLNDMILQEISIIGVAIISHMFRVYPIEGSWENLK